MALISGDGWQDTRIYGSRSKAHAGLTWYPSDICRYGRVFLQWRKVK